MGESATKGGRETARGPVATGGPMPRTGPAGPGVAYTLFKRLDGEGRLLHKDWDRYDTAHCVFRPRHMSPEQLERGYAWMYQRTFSARSIWRRRPAEPSAVPPYLAMALLYKRCNPLWTQLIRQRLVHATWAPLVEASLRRQLCSRRRLAQRGRAERRGGAQARSAA